MRSCKIFLEAKNRDDMLIKQGSQGPSQVSVVLAVAACLISRSESIRNRVVTMPRWLFCQRTRLRPCAQGTDLEEEQAQGVVSMVPAWVQISKESLRILLATHNIAPVCCCLVTRRTLSSQDLAYHAARALASLERSPLPKGNCHARSQNQDLQESLSRCRMSAVPRRQGTWTSQGVFLEDMRSCRINLLASLP